jgi:hypothetical protein
MNESLVKYLWFFGNFLNNIVETVDKNKLQIIQRGTLNNDAGPDVFNAKIKLNQTIWAGNIEFHLKSSDWNKHKHQFDKAYNNVILHVVYENDKEIFKENGDKIEVLEIKKFVSPEILKQYEAWINSKNPIPCHKELPKTDSFIFENWKNRLLVERIIRKTAFIENHLEKSKNNWEQIFFILLVKSFGFNTNTLPFELLAKSIDFKLFEKYKNQPKIIEALLFGQAGLLNENFHDEHPRWLKKEYEFLQKKHQLTPINQELWKFLRTRPKNFPTIRLFQLSVVLSHFDKLFSPVIQSHQLQELTSLFSLNFHSSYWDNHYKFDESSTKTIKNLGKNAVESLIINFIIPFKFYYANTIDNETEKETTLAIYEKLQAEKNTIINTWKTNNIQVKNAYDSQALIELKTQYCDKKNCLRCAIGSNFIKTFC